MDTGCQQHTLSEQERQALWRLRSKWLGMYHVALIDDVWRAKRYSDVTKLLTADSADELGDKITADYGDQGSPPAGLRSANASVTAP